jgi:hypothetical protein
MSYKTTEIQTSCIYSIAFLITTYISKDIFVFPTNCMIHAWEILKLSSVCTFWILCLMPWIRDIMQVETSTTSKCCLLKSNQPLKFRGIVSYNSYVEIIAFMTQKSDSIILEKVRENNMDWGWVTISITPK